MLQNTIFNLLIALLVSVPISYVFYRLRFPVLVGFIITGILIGPSLLSLIKDMHYLESLAEIGVIFLMFLLGLEFSVKKFLSYKREVFLAGFLQVLLTTFLIALISILLLKVDLNRAIFYGALIAFSSTAVVLKILMERAEINTPYGRYIFGILIFQDLSVIVVMLVLPLLIEPSLTFKTIGMTFLKSLSIFILIFLIGLKVIPPMIYQIAKTRNRELFLISLFVISLGSALFSYKLGLSMAMGAFVAGMILSESELVYQIIAEIKPLKDFFLALFFIVVGALLDIKILYENLFTILGVFFLIFFLKIFLVFGVVYFIGKNLRNALLSALYLFQIGEFSFVLAMEGKKIYLISQYFYQIFMALSVLSFLLTPFVISLAYRFSEYLLIKIAPRKLDLISRRRKAEETYKKIDTIVVGFGVCGRNVALGLKLLKIPYIVLELNLSTVKHYRKKGEPIYFGDATNTEILRKFGIEKTQVLVITVGDSFTARNIIKMAKEINPHIYILARSQFVVEIEELLKLGANEVISEEFEASLELFVKILDYFQVPKNEILDLVEELRSEHYEILRKEDISLLAKPLPQEWWKLFKVQTYFVKEKSPLSGLTLKRLNLRAKTGATVIAIQRGEELLINPSAETYLKEGDLIVLIGDELSLSKATRFLNEPYEAWY